MERLCVCLSLSFQLHARLGGSDVAPPLRHLSYFRESDLAWSLFSAVVMNVFYSGGRCRLSPLPAVLTHQEMSYWISESAVVID